jgi:predicted Zn-dependent peptidase
MLKPQQLKNGLTVLKIPKSGTNTMLVGYVAASGSSTENGNWPEGISSFLQRMFLYGTDKHPSPRSLNQALESIGGTFYTLAGHEMSQLFLVVPSYHQYKATSIMAEIIQHSYFEERDVLREKNQLVESLKSGIDFENTKASELAMLNLYRNNSLSSPARGSVDSIIDIERKDVMDYFAHQYRPDKSYLVFAGNFDNKGLMELIDQEWAYWNPGSRVFIPTPQIHADSIGPLPRIIYMQRGISYTDLALGFVLDEGYACSGLISSDEELNPNQNDKEEINTRIKNQKLVDFAYLTVLNAIIGKGRSSRLWSKGVEDELLFSGIESDLILFKSTGFLQIKGRSENSQFTFALEAVLSVLESLKKTTISINELSKAKEFIKGQMIMEHEDLVYSTLWQLENLIGSEFEYTLEDLIEQINKVEANNLRSIAMDLFIPERMTITTFGTAKETRLVEKLIRKYLG